METEYFNVENFRYEKDKMEILWGPISGGGVDYLEPNTNIYAYSLRP